MAHELTIAELSLRTGEPVEHLERWRSVGLIGHGDGPGFGPEDVERASLIQLLLRRGFALGAIARADKEQHLLRNYVEIVFPGGATLTYSLEEAAERAGLAVDLVRRFAEAVGLAEHGEIVTEEDMQMIRVLKVALDAGFPEDALFQIARVQADTLGRVAEAESRLFHFFVRERLRAAGVSGPELVEQTRAAQDRLRPLIEPVLFYFHRRGLARAAREDAVLQLAEESGLPKAELPGRFPVAISWRDG